MKKILTLFCCAISLCAQAVKPEEGHKINLSSGAEMTIFSPEKPDGRVVVAYPGGGYAFVSLGNEGFDATEWMLDHNITYAVVNYTLPETMHGKQSDSSNHKPKSSTSIPKK